MTARLLDGKHWSKVIQTELQARITAFRNAAGRPPGLAVVLVGDDPASEIYVRNKERACTAAGVSSRLVKLPSSTSQPDLLATIRELNRDDAVDGLLVQMPLPAQIAGTAVIDAIDPRKDVDGFHPFNTGLLAQGRPRFVPCTPLGIWDLLQREGVPLAGQKVAILGRSNIVGKPLALLLAQNHPKADATVILCHSKSRGWPELLRDADVVVAAVGRPHLVTADMVRPGAVVVDVGINRLPDGRIAGDVDTGAVRAVASAITPVPGGVGPMTIAMLLANTVAAAELRLSRDAS